MAQSMSPVVPTQPISAVSSVTRSTSIKSTNSASSGVSLRRRARTRTRTPLNDTGRRGKSTGPRGTSVQDASGSGSNAQATVPNRTTTLPEPTRSTRRSVDAGIDTATVVQELVVPSIRERTYSAVHIREVPVEAGRGRLARSEGGSAKNTHRKLRGVSLPRSAFRHPASSDESSEASPRTPTDFQPFVRFSRMNPRPGIRDSMISSSSSLYPASTSTESYPESSLLSPKDKDGEASSFTPRIVTSSDFDVDDVSYRLRLLVNNNYFLPPAHNKPSPLALSPPTPGQEQKAGKPAAPGFFDFFRMGKSKSKPTTPICHSPPALDKPPPLLRTTSDSTTAGGFVQRPQAGTQPQAPAVPSFSPAASQNRVVVLRERMDDLMAAAKQAERDIKSRGDGRKAQSLTSPKTTFDDVIDPTDAVDLPPSSAAFPLLGPGEAVGADLLANQLPPSPGMWSMSSEEVSWRKAILQEAVSLSLSESPEQSFVATLPGSTEPPSPSSFRGPTEDKPEEPASPPTPKAAALIGQRILEPTELDTAAQNATALSPLTGVQALPGTQSLSDHGHPSAELTEQPWRSTLSPPRAETPALTQPLTPPPPRRSPQHSTSMNDLQRAATVDSNGSRPKDILSTLRRAMSSPRLSAVSDETVSPVDSQPESIGQRMFAMSPPLDPTSQNLRTLSARPSTNSLLRASPLFSDDDDLSYATPMDEMDDEPHVRPSMTLSIPTIGRPSMSEYSNPSPTASAFNDVVLQDAVFGSCRSPSPMVARRSHIGSLPASSSTTSATRARSSTVSPPPRESSTFGTVLPPPPRAPAVRPIYRPSTTPSSVSVHTTSTHGSAPLYSAAEPGSEEESNLPLSESPTSERSPTSALAERRGLPSLLSLHIPTEVPSPALHSAPAPASPTAFFDRIQSHPNAMDDLETSDESDNEEPPLPMPPPIMPPPSPRVPESPRMSSSSRSSVKGALARLSHSGVRPTIMRLGNHSSPHLTSSSGQEFPAFDLDPRKPIGNIPEQGTFFTERSRKKSGKGHAPFPLPVGAASIAQLHSTSGASTSTAGAQSRSRSTSRRPATSSSAQEKARPSHRESLQKFDGMLLEHIAAERDTIKRITSNISSSRS